MSKISTDKHTDRQPYLCGVRCVILESYRATTIMVIHLYRSEAKLEHKREAITTKVEWKGNTGSVLRTDYR